MSKRKAKVSKTLDKESKKLKEEDNDKTGSVDLKTSGDELKSQSKDYGSVGLSDNDIGFNVKIMSWNVSGLRAVLKKDGLKAINGLDADIVCLQEIKCAKKDIPEEINVWAKYKHKYYSTTKTKGYSGVSLFSKEKPISVTFGIGSEEHDSEGRVITAEFDKYYVITAYVPNSGRGLVNLVYRQKWDKDFREYLKAKDALKPVILCGDLNVSHKEIDLENPKTNTKTAGFTKEEREGFTQLLAEGFIDSFRHLYPNQKKCYTFWSYLRQSRQKDIGWRLDYFLLSNRLQHNPFDQRIAKHIMGSDHCPVLLLINV